MHELALMQSLVETVESEVPRGEIHALAVEVGELAAVVPEALYFCFELCTENTRLDTAVLEVIDVPAVYRCRRCDGLVEDGPEQIGWPWTPRCPCGETALDVVQGSEIALKHVEISNDSNRETR